MFIIGEYVDDIILAAETEKRLNDVKLVLAKRFDIKDMGKLHYFLGMKVVQNNEGIWSGSVNLPILTIFFRSLVWKMLSLLKFLLILVPS